MGRKAFNNAKRQLESAGFDIAESEYEKAHGNWHITLDTVHKVRLAWSNAEHILSVEEETDDKLNGLTVWRYIFASKLIDQNEIPTTVESILKTN